MSESASERLAASARVVAAKSRDIIVSTRDRIDRYIEGHAAAELTTGAAPAPSEQDAQGLFGFVLVFDETGLLKPAQGSSAGGISISGRDYFASLQHGAQWSVSGLVQQSAFGEPVFGIARRLTENDEFAGAAVMYVPADAIVEALPALELGENATVALHRSDGAVITQYPFPLHGMAPSLDASSLQEMKRGSGMLHKHRIGEPRVTAFESIGDMGMVATASLPQAPLLQAAQERAMTTLLAVAPVALVLLLVCVLMAMALVRQERYVSAIDAAARQNETLLQEIHHRIKNNLQMVAGMVRLQGDEGDRDVLARRIQAMTTVHQLMYESNAFAAVDAAVYIEKLLEGLAQGYDKTIRLERRVDSVSLSPDQLQPIGLIITEAVTNALKHAFPDDRPGTIRVELIQHGAHAELVVEDNGVGTDLTAPARMGSKLIRNLARQLGGELKTGAERGTRISVLFPLHAAN